MHYSVQLNNINQITDISTLQFTRKLRNFMHIIGMQSSRTAITLSGSVPAGNDGGSCSGWIKKWISRGLYTYSTDI